MSVTCLNCGYQVEGNYCPNCSQKATAGRLNASVLLKDVLHFFTHLESGFLFTTWSFIIRPGLSSQAYISGKRQKYQKPVSYFLIWASLYIIIHSTIVNQLHYQLAGEIVSEMNIKEQSNILFREHFNLFIIPVILLSAFLLYLILARPIYNFIEILVLALYGAGTYFMMSLLIVIIAGYIFNVNILSTNIFIIQAILSSVYNFWFAFDFFKRSPIPYFGLRLIIVSVLIALGGWLIMFYLPMAWLYFAESQMVK